MLLARLEAVACGDDEHFRIPKGQVCRIAFDVERLVGDYTPQAGDVLRNVLGSVLVGDRTAAADVRVQVIGDIDAALTQAGNAGIAVGGFQIECFHFTGAGDLEVGVGYSAAEYDGTQSGNVRAQRFILHVECDLTVAADIDQEGLSRKSRLTHDAGATGNLNTLEEGQCDVDRRTGAVDVQGTTIDAGLSSFATVTMTILTSLGCILTDETLATERISIPVKGGNSRVSVVCALAPVILG